MSLEGLLVVALEQAVAAPYCTSRLADAGADVFIHNLAPVPALDEHGAAIREEFAS